MGGPHANLLPLPRARRSCQLASAASCTACGSGSTPVRRGSLQDCLVLRLPKSLEIHIALTAAASRGKSESVAPSMDSEGRWFVDLHMARKSDSVATSQHHIAMVRRNHHRISAVTPLRRSRLNKSLALASQLPSGVFVSITACINDKFCERKSSRCIRKRHLYLLWNYSACCR